MKVSLFQMCVLLSKNILFLGMKNPKSKIIYEKTNQLAEKLSTAVFFVIVKVSVPCIVFPKCIISYIVYFTTDLGADAFDSPLPMWWV